MLLPKSIHDVDDEFVNAILERYDRTKPSLQRRIVAEMIIKLAVYKELLGCEPADHPDYQSKILGE